MSLAIPGTVTVYADFLSRIVSTFPIITRQNWTLADIVEHCVMSGPEFDALNPGAPSLATDVVEGDTWNVVVHISDDYTVLDVPESGIVIGFVEAPSGPTPPAGLNPAPIFSYGWQTPVPFEFAVFLNNFDNGAVSGNNYRGDRDRYGFNGRLFAMLALNPAISSFSDTGPFKLVLNKAAIPDDGDFGSAMLPPYFGYLDFDDNSYLYILGQPSLRTVGGPWATPGGAEMRVLFPGALGWIPIEDVS